MYGIQISVKWAPVFKENDNSFPIWDRSFSAGSTAAFKTKSASLILNILLVSCY